MVSTKTNRFETVDVLNCVLKIQVKIFLVYVAFCLLLEGITITSTLYEE